MASACDRARRSPDLVKLVVVTKSVDVFTIRQLLDLGVTDIGESQVQELVRRAAMIQETLQRMPLASDAAPPDAPNWHMVGHLQRNKVKTLVPWVHVIHSLDTLRLAEDLSAAGEKRDQRIDALLQVNAGEEPQKFGVAVAAAPHVVEQFCTLPGLRLRGLMGMAPLTDDRDRLRRVFVRLREVFDEIRGARLSGPAFDQLSMGMTQDFEIAIEEGATIVRVGTALFEGIV